MIKLEFVLAKKEAIRITESQLRRIVKESVKKVLDENVAVALNYDEYEEPIIEEPTIDEYNIDIDIPTEPEPTKKNNGIKTMGIAAGIGLAVGASALGAHTIIKSREDDDEDADYGYEK